MSINLLETVQKNLGYPALKKVDPNTEEVKGADKTPVHHEFSQAAIPAILTGMYKYVQVDDGAQDFLDSDHNGEPWTDKVFFDHKSEAINSISAYAWPDLQDPVAEMNKIANEAERVVKENLPKNAGIKDVKQFFKDQRNDILKYLLPELNMGEWLHEPSLDDKTNKMEGPISSLMNKIGASLSNIEEPKSEDK